MKKFIALLLGIGLSLCTLSIASAEESPTLAELERAADFGDATARERLLERYKAQPSLIRDHEWYFKLVASSAFEGNPQSQLVLARSLDNITDPSSELINLTLAFYSAIDNKSPQAESRYTQLLEQKFNAKKRAQVQYQPKDIQDLPKDLSDELVDHQSSSLITPSSPAVPMIPLWVTSIIIFSLGTTALSIAYSLRARHQLSTIDTHGMSEKIKLQQATIERQTAQIKKARQLLAQRAEATINPKRQPSGNSSSQSRALVKACLLFGYSPEKLPKHEQIKQQYKKLSHLYHPDRHGDCEKMKAINKAFTLLTQQSKR
ncbi:DnaJ domain-containing protein [Vibrio sp. FNV 38]|nr:DnaJ domain-containing protein [Vibrio sp. FNV 38]